MQSQGVVTVRTPHPIVWGVYRASVAIRKSALLSAFGFVSECKHTPSCGQNLVEQLSTNGLRSGTVKAVVQLLTCV